MHRKCIGCEENTRQGSPPNTRQGSPPRIPPQQMKHGLINELSKVHFLVRPGSHFPVPAVHFSTARRARTSQCRPPLRRPPAGLGIDRPSTVLRLQEAETIIGMVLCKVFVPCGSDRHPSWPRPAASGQAGLGRAANAGPRDRARSSPLQRGAAQRTANIQSVKLKRWKHCLETFDARQSHTLAPRSAPSRPRPTGGPAAQP